MASLVCGTVERSISFGTAARPSERRSGALRNPFASGLNIHALYGFVEGRACKRMVPILNDVR